MTNSPSIDETLNTYWQAKTAKNNKQYDPNILPYSVLSPIADYVNEHCDGVFASVREAMFSSDNIDRLVLTFPRGVSYKHVVEVKNIAKGYAKTDEDLAGQHTSPITLIDEQIATNTAHKGEMRALRGGAERRQLGGSSSDSERGAFR